MRLCDSIKQYSIRSTLIGMLLTTVVLVVIGALAGCGEEEPDMQQQSATKAQFTPVATPISATSTPAPTEQPIQPTPTALPERCNAEMRSQVPELVDWLRYAGTRSDDLADSLDEAPTPVLLAEGDNLANQLYDSAESMNEVADKFPDRGVSDDLREFGNVLETTGFFLEYRVTDEEAVEAVEGLREIARQAPRLANQIEVFC